MIKFDADTINEMVTTYLYDDIDGRDTKILDDVEYLWKQLERAMFNYQHGEISKVLNSFQMCEFSEDEKDDKKAVRGVKAEDVAFIATHYGFLFGLVWSENRRLHFWN